MAQLVAPWKAAKRAILLDSAEPQQPAIKTVEADRDNASGGGVRRVLLLASLYEMPYRILVCAAAAGAEVYVLGNAGARPLRLSRFCGPISLKSDAVPIRANPRKPSRKIPKGWWESSPAAGW